MTEKVFEFCVVLHPTKNERDDGGRASIIVDPQVCVASSLDEAKTIAARAIPDGFADDLDRCEVIVRPFA